MHSAHGGALNKEAIMAEAASSPTNAKTSKFSNSKPSQSKSTKSTVSIAMLDEIFGYPPLIYGEDIKDYESLEHSIRSTLVPKDALEEIWVRDIVDAQWEILRYKKIKPAIVNASNGNPPVFNGAHL